MISVYVFTDLLLKTVYLFLTLYLKNMATLIIIMFISANKRMK